MTDSEPPESWLVGVAVAGDQLASMRVHAGYLAAGPASGRAHRVHVRLRLLAPTSSGFPTNEEALDLNVAEERVVRANAPHAVLVAVVTAPGFRDLILHTAEPDRLEKSVLEPGFLADLGYEPVTDIDHDPSWTFYRALFSDAVVADADRRVVARYHEAGHDPAQPCLARYFVRFDSREEAVAARQVLLDAHLEADVVLPDGDRIGTDQVITLPDVVSLPEPSAGEALLVIRDEVHLTQAEAARAREGVAAFAVSWGGSFEGWRVDPLPPA